MEFSAGIFRACLFMVFIMSSLGGAASEMADVIKFENLSIPILLDAGPQTEGTFTYEAIDGVRSAGADGIVFLSGDGNIVDPLVGDEVAVDPGNQQFFTNILQGGTQVAVLQNTFGGCCENFDENIDEFYNSLPGITSTAIIGTVDAASLTGVDLFLSAIPDEAVKLIPSLDLFKGVG